MEMMMKKYLLAASVIALMATPALAEECAPVTKPQVEQLFDRWNASLATLDPEKVVENYAPDAVLLPTLSNKPRLTQEERKKYFVDFLKKHPQGKIDSRTIKLGCNEALDTGIYTFTLKDGAKVPARYTFTYEFKDGKWLISSHHSSAMPEKHSG
jgi:uncharacterized protein (TIGR02246 family)